ncbi:trans-sulfuration enzyme family protein [Companilactobacillus mishanensis]|uniref:trans-sulfuration enzyme family protein n=1 Tax=Companilactobacillus mishanensis TaxID=2486008 RepID=UPI00129515B9|nr:PLP-dependent aspartate aminotransferase family protein [Companilactobacillus mishanensis]MQS90289.1 PLP-dependent transferase [Companilactobacillus mishanensis]
MSEFDTTLIHGGGVDDNNTGAVNVPIYNSSTYKYPELLGQVRWDYARSGNPTRESVERLMAHLEDGSGAYAFSSGMAAIHAVFSIFKPGDHVIIGKNIYGGTFRLINEYLKDYGIKFTSIDTRDLDSLEKCIQANTKAIYFETLTNPLLQFSDVKSIGKIAKKHGLLTIVDNTFLTPYLQKPLTMGADLVVHSATKYLSGHSDLMAGVVVAKDKEVGDKIYQAQNTMGATLSPQDSNLLQRGIKTLSVRMDRHIENVKHVIEFLKSDPKVAKIYYPGCDGDANFDNIKDQCAGFGGVLSFELQPGLDVKGFINHLQLFTLAVSLGAVESLAEVPAFMSHFEIPKETRLQIGIKDELVRLSVGIEDYRDLIKDLEQALRFA